MATVDDNYNCIELDIDKNGNLLNVDSLSLMEQKALSARNVVYIYRGTKSRNIYIGQTGNFIRRHKEHYDGTEEKFNNADFPSCKIK